MASAQRRRFPVGAELLPDGGVHLRVWAPARRRVEVVLGPPGGTRALPLEAEGSGYFSAAVPGARAGDRYAFRLDGEPNLLADPASRFQPDGPDGSSQVVDPRFAWTDGDWRGIERSGQVLYEMHVGTFTAEGTFAAAARELPSLHELGVTAVELMPVADWSGRFGWGYDGVNPWAPTRNYGTPDDLRRFVDAAHRARLGVILDVVYNHFGPEGNHVEAFSPFYFSDRKTEWGRAINFDGEAAGPVRELFIENARYWVEEFHVDGLRFDATQNIYDDGARGEHVLAAIARRVREAAGSRAVYLVAENEPQDARLVREPARGGYGLDALWNDDFHHAARVALTGRREAYYSDYRGRPQELISAVKWGYLFQGQWYDWQHGPRGTPALDLDANRFVIYLENHDQVANSGRGARLAASAEPARLRAMTALLLLAPGTPLLFQGQEWGSRRPFLYFADHGHPLAESVRRGRARFLSQFPSLAAPDVQAALPDPAARETFEACKLDHAEREVGVGAATYALHRDLLRLRRGDAAFRQQRADRVQGAVLGSDALVLRFSGAHAGDERLLLVNLGRDIDLLPAPEPLLAPPGGARWCVRWSSEAARYGGEGTPASAAGGDGEWPLPGGTALVLAPEGTS